jgi:DNA-binding transcriptional LysR family regulator
MELRHLRYFLAVAEHQGFRKAALFLRVSHPWLCAQIIDLETEIGTRLFERTNQRVSLTAAGHTFISGARRTLESALIQGAQKRADIGIGYVATESSGGPTGPSKVGSSPPHRSV